MFTDGRRSAVGRISLQTFCCSSTQSLQHLCCCAIPCSCSAANLLLSGQSTMSSALQKFVSTRLRFCELSKGLLSESDPQTAGMISKDENKMCQQVEEILKKLFNLTYDDCCGTLTMVKGSALTSDSKHRLCQAVLSKKNANPQAGATAPAGQPGATAPAAPAALSRTMSEGFFQRHQQQLIKKLFCWIMSR